MKNLLFYVAFLGLVAWAGNRQYNQAPAPSSIPAVMSDTSAVTKLKNDPATVQTVTYMHQQ